MGVNCRYDRGNKLNAKVVEMAKVGVVVPVCPEQLAGLPTPREQTEIRDGKVFTKSGKDVTKAFELGAKETLNIAREAGAEEAILKQRSAACGSGQIYDGSFSGKVIGGDGLTTKLLKENGLKVVSEEEL
jgi:uncharacterized protein YbbK (DUF523 family)|tara:strand:+ start:751 stop:1140 length:390 start_codon:yes stop_codon:yes gene_type:complete